MNASASASGWFSKRPSLCHSMIGHVVPPAAGVKRGSSRVKSPSRSPATVCSKDRRASIRPLQSTQPEVISNRTTARDGLRLFAPFGPFCSTPLLFEPKIAEFAKTRNEGRSSVRSPELPPQMPVLSWHTPLTERSGFTRVPHTPPKMSTRHRFGIWILVLTAITTFALLMTGTPMVSISSAHIAETGETKASLHIHWTALLAAVAFIVGMILALWPRSAHSSKVTNSESVNQGS